MAGTGLAGGRIEGGGDLTEHTGRLDNLGSGLLAGKKIVVLPAQNGRLGTARIQKTPGEILDPNIEGQNLNGIWHLIFVLEVV
jgi:hypothetical protein